MNAQILEKQSADRASRRKASVFPGDPTDVSQKPSSAKLDLDRTPLPGVFDTIQACAGATGIPLALIKKAKKSGCPAFRYNQVILRPLLAWIFADEREDEDWGKKLTRAKALREEIRLEKDKGRALDKDEVAFAIGKTIAALASLLDRYANIELPPLLKGLDERPIQTTLAQKFEEAMAKFKAGLGEIQT